jgi:hypothetical protein
LEAKEGHCNPNGRLVGVYRYMIRIEKDWEDIAN